RKLEARDKEVRDHERAHASAGAALASAPSYEMMVGPDGHKYAVGGEVKINLVKAKSPEDTIEKMEKVIKAALAPIRPSAGDRRVAEEARQIQMEAKIEIAREKAEERKEKIDEHKEERPMPTSANSDFTSRAMNAYDQAAELKSEKGQTHSQNAEL
ncbi:MAG: hypothetical protein HON65_08195, partial [Rhodospirillales bacterium]|nr:hypothetical protein [Rhodospirillales bacterium]